jgi:hypothetical protein
MYGTSSCNSICPGVMLLPMALERSFLSRKASELTGSLLTSLISNLRPHEGQWRKKVLVPDMRLQDGSPYLRARAEGLVTESRFQ